MNKSSKLVRGIGFNSRHYPSRIDGKNVKEYNLWQGMLHRCTKEYWLEWSAYDGVTCSDDFKDYTFFYEWCNKQVGFGNADENGRSWQLDKDLLVKGNKIYNENVCVFVPQRINNLLIKRDACRGELQVGVHRLANGRGYIAKCNIGTGTQKYLGYFNTPQEAFQAYKTYKEGLIKEVANEYKEMLDSRVYEALMNYEVNEND